MENKNIILERKIKVRNGARRKSEVRFRACRNFSDTEMKNVISNGEKKKQSELARKYVCASKILFVLGTTLKFVNMCFVKFNVYAFCSGLIFCEKREHLS